MWLNCRDGLHRLRTSRVTLRELRASDAATLFPLLHDPEVRRQMSHGPTDLRAFHTFIEWTQRERQVGRHLCYGLVPHDETHAVGLIQVWPIEPTGRTVEWGFALGQPHWRQGIFHEAALAIVDHAISALGVQRFEARAALSNVRGNAALARLGAVREGVLRQCFCVNGAPADYVMWSILSSDWSSAHGTHVTTAAQETEPSCRVG